MKRNLFILVQILSENKLHTTGVLKFRKYIFTNCHFKKRNPQFRTNISSQDDQRLPDESEKYIHWCLKLLVPSFPLSPYLGADGLTVSTVQRYDHHSPEGSQILVIPGIIPPTDWCEYYSKIYCYMIVPCLHFKMEKFWKYEYKNLQIQPIRRKSTN